MGNAVDVDNGDILVKHAEYLRELYATIVTSLDMFYVPAERDKEEKDLKKLNKQFKYFKLQARKKKKKIRKMIPISLQR